MKRIEYFKKMDSRFEEYDSKGLAKILLSKIGACLFCEYADLKHNICSFDGPCEWIITRWFEEEVKND